MAPHPGPRAVSADPPVFCALTRFGLRSPRHLLTLRRQFSTVAGDAERRGVPGLLRSAFLVENASTCYSLSIWSGEPYISALVPSHIDAANGVFGKLALDETRGPELWSTQWKLVTVSNNLNWDGFDLGGLLEPDPMRDAAHAVD
ncbi:MAG TPA: hypothetical protein VF529_03410 [Solirubrobacteraceae bacterium]|jgi:hypothetical protein